MRPVSTRSHLSHYAPDNLERPEHWGKDALCRTSKVPDLWFPEGDDAGAKADRRQAKQICATCPAQPSCLTDALERGETVGVWGGLDEDERRSLLVYRPAGRTASAAPAEEGSSGPPAEHAATA